MIHFQVTENFKPRFKTETEGQILSDEDYETIKNLFIETALKYLFVRDFSRFDATQEIMDRLFGMDISTDQIITFLVHAHLVDVIEGSKKLFDSIIASQEGEKTITHSASGD